MILKVGRGQLLGIVAILALFFAAEFALNGFNLAAPQQAQLQAPATSR